MNLQDTCYELKFKVAFISEKGDSFQSLFARLMGLAYGPDFMACRPWGGQGDHKNDGYLKSEHRLFQVYAPNEMKASKATSKITEDFEGAKPYWGEYFDKWTFVHNAYDGLPPHIHKLLLSLEAANSGIRLEAWGWEQLRTIFGKLSVEDKESWFGSVPTEETRARLGYRDLQVVLERIATLPAPISTEVSDVPMGKIQANALDPSVAYLLKEGMIKAPLVADFLCQCYDETLGERLAGAFKAEYRRLREQHHPPNDIFAELQTWVGGDLHGTPEHQLAVLTVLAYYFERCDIFEEPRRDVQ